MCILECGVVVEGTEPVEPQRSRMVLFCVLGCSFQAQVLPSLPGTLFSQVCPAVTLTAHRAAMSHSQALQSRLHHFFSGLCVLQSPEAICFPDLAVLLSWVWPTPSISCLHWEAIGHWGINRCIQSAASTRWVYLTACSSCS